MSSTIRPMEEQDLPLVWQWRNSQRIRSASFNSEIIEYDQHLKWWQQQAQNKLSEHLVFEWNNQPVGVVSFRYNDSKSEAEWSFYIGNPVEKGLGLKMAKKALEYAFINTSLNSVVGRVIGFNEKSDKLHLAAGFKLVSEQKNGYTRDGIDYDIREYRFERHSEAL